MSEQDAMPLAYPDQSADDFTGMVKRGNEGFLNRVELGQPLSDFVTAGTAKAGEFMFGREKLLGGSFDAVLMCRSKGNEVIPCYRPHALCLQDKEVEAESFDPNSDVFQKIVAEAKKKLKIEGRATMYGVDLLFWLPRIEDFFVYYFAKTARRQADEFYKLGKSGKVINFTQKKIQTAYTWWVPVALESTTPIEQLAPHTPAGLQAAHELFFSPLLPDAQPKQDATTSDDRPR